MARQSIADATRADDLAAAYLRSHFGQQEIEQRCRRRRYHAGCSSGIRYTADLAYNGNLTALDLPQW